MSVDPERMIVETWASEWIRNPPKDKEEIINRVKSLVRGTMAAVNRKNAELLFLNAQMSENKENKDAFFYVAKCLWDDAKKIEKGEQDD